MTKEAKDIVGKAKVLKASFIGGRMVEAGSVIQIPVGTKQLGSNLELVAPIKVTKSK